MGGSKIEWPEGTIFRDFGFDPKEMSRTTVVVVPGYDAIEVIITTVDFCNQTTEKYGEYVVRRLYESYLKHANSVEIYKSFQGKGYY